MFLLSLVYLGPLRLPYIPRGLQPDHQRRREYRLGTVWLNVTKTYWILRAKKNSVIPSAQLE